MWYRIALCDFFSKWLSYRDGKLHCKCFCVHQRLRFVFAFDYGLCDSVTLWVGHAEQHSEPLRKRINFIHRVC